MRYSSPVLALVVSACVSAFAAAQETEAPFADQLHEMLDLLFRASSLNVIHGLELTEAQARELRTLALDLRGPTDERAEVVLEPRFAQARAAGRELIAVLERGAAVPDDLRQKVTQARAAETAAIRETLAWNPEAEPRSCARCHRALAGEGAARIGLGTPAGFSVRPPQAKQEQVLSHLLGGMGGASLTDLRQAAPKVGAILTRGQREILGNFSCCLLPPTDLSDPVRVGQAAVPDREAKLLDFARSIPVDRWPAAQARIADWVERIAVMKRPDLGAAEREAFRRRVREACERARSMSDLDYELDKVALATTLRVAVPSPASSPEGIELQAAFFLLGPGTVAAYDRVIERKHAETEAPTAAPRLDGLVEAAPAAT